MIASDGEVLITNSSQMYRVLPGYDFYSKVWQPAETIVICENALVWFEGERRMIYEIVNKDENNESEPVVLAYVRVEGTDIDPDYQVTRSQLVSGTEVRAKVRCGDARLGYSIFYGVWEFLYEKVVFYF